MQKTFNQLKYFFSKVIGNIILCCLVLLLGIAPTAYAAVTETPLEQTWYSGQSNSKYFLDFTTEPPTVTCGSPVGQSTGNEGTANFTDPNSGQLKLYTDGISVFNGQTNQVLDNGTGLNGKPSAGEAAMIVPVPGADGDQFYIFTNSIGSVSYSLADLSQGSNGTITVKNEPLAKNTGEALGIVPHTNGTDFWVLVFNTAAKVDAYKVDPSGIASTPVSSNTGYSGSLGRASIIYSPDYNTLALGWAGTRIATAKIDRTTGMISNISQKVTGAVGYATAFSSDGTKLYYALGAQGYSGYPYQVDLNTGVKTKLSTTTAFGGPKLAPDGKIYWTAKNKPALSVVNNPNGAGTAANFALNGLNLKGCYGSWNLPNQTAASLQQINRVPVTDAAIPDQVATEDSLFRYPIPADTFSDPDGDQLTLSATLSNGDPLPDWLTFDPASNSFSGTPTRPDVGVIDLTVTADDGKEGLISTDFKITVNEICHPDEPLAGAFRRIRIGDLDGFGFKEGTGLKSATGSAINVDGTGLLSTKDFLPDFNGDGKISNRDAGDPFDNRSDAEVAGTFLTGDGFEDMGSKGSDYTDLSLGKVFGYKTSSTYGNSFPDGDPNTLPNTPGFKFHFKVAKDKLPQGTPLFFNVIFGDYDVEPISIIFTNSQGQTVTRELTASAQGKNDGLITSAFATLDFSDVFTDGDTSGEAGYWVGYLDVDFDAPEEPYLSFDFAEIGTKQIPLTPCSGGTTPVEGKIVNIDSTKNLSPETATKLTLPAGQYTIHVIGQADGGNYDAWTRTELIDGCDGNGENCTKGWEHKYFYQLGNTDSVKVDRTDRYSTAEAALANPPADVSFTLTEETEVDFYVVDGGDPSNNQGGVSLQVISQS